MTSAESADFRRRQHAEPSPALAAAEGLLLGGSSSLAACCDDDASLFPSVEPSCTQDLSRVILHVDLDCFYAQVEELLDPKLKGRPLAVTQKYLCVTSNYEARALGVGKLMSIVEAKRKAPGLVLRCGEDLTRYREFSAKAEKVLRGFGTVERLGMDEFYVDCSRLVSNRTEGEAYFHGNVLEPGAELRADTAYRPQDLRGTKAGAEETTLVGEGATDVERRLAAGTAIAADARRVLRDAHGLRASCGIAVNKLLAKLIGGVHKPDDQTVLLPARSADFIARLPVRVIKGVGAKTESRLRAIGCETCLELRMRTEREIARAVGDSAEMAAFLHACAWGIDNSPVVPKGPPKVVSVEDSFKGIALEKGVPLPPAILGRLSSHLVTRVDSDSAEHKRRPRTLTLTVRTREERSKRRFSSPYPSPAGGCIAVEEAALDLLRKAVGRSAAEVTLINIAASNFERGAPLAASGFEPRRRRTAPPSPFKAARRDQEACKRPRAEIGVIDEEVLRAMPLEIQEEYSRAFTLPAAPKKPTSSARGRGKSATGTITSFFASK